MLVEPLAPSPPPPSNRSPFALSLLSLPPSGAEGPAKEQSPTSSLTARSTAHGKKPTLRRTAVWITRNRSPTASASLSLATWPDD